MARVEEGESVGFTGPDGTLQRARVASQPVERW
jgi:hypothetical protein